MSNVAIVWLTGIIPSYLLLKLAIKNGDNWTVGDRNYAIVLSLIFSWLGLIGGIIVLLMSINFNNNKKAKW